MDRIDSTDSQQNSPEYQSIILTEDSKLGQNLNLELESTSLIQNERQLEKSISNFVKVGIIIASSIVLFGGTLYLVHHGAEPANYDYFRGEPSVLRSPKTVLESALIGDVLSIIQLGILVIIITPIARVALSALIFWERRDWAYVFFTLFVLTGLIYSLIG